jgi:signal peptidase II
MQKAGNPLVKWRILAIVLIVIAVVIADQITKSLIAAYPVGEVISELGFIRIVHIYNTGSAFSMFQGWVFALRAVACVGVAALVVFAVWCFRKYPQFINKWNTVTYALILGGAIGNMIDRLRFGYVTDFVDVGFWPVFNVADSALSVGEVMIVIALLRQFIAERKKPRPVD